MNDDEDRTASLMTPAKLAQVASKPRPAVTGAAWLDRMATDAGHQHVAALVQLRGELLAQAASRDFSALAGGLAHLARELPQLDFGLLQPKGFMARLSGKGKTAGADFAKQYDRIDSAIDGLSKQGQALQATQGEHAGRTDKALLEFEVEFRALDKIIDSASRWLADMRNQLKTREAQAADDPAAMQQVRQDAQRCELLVARLKLLRAVGSSAQVCQQQAQAAASRRAALVQALQGSLASRIKQWRARLSPLASAARGGDTPSLSLEGPMDCHRDLQLSVKEAAADCAQLQAQELSLTGALESLDSQLQAASH